MNNTTTQRVKPEQWTEFNMRLKDGGAHLLALTAFADERLEASWLKRHNVLTAILDGSAAYFPSLAIALPEVAADEREIHDLFGYVPMQHPDLRPIVRTPRWPVGFYPLASRKAPSPAWMDVQPENPVRVVKGEGVTTMKVGPTHAGVIESGHFVFSLIGENILGVDLHLFQNHRGIEAALQDLPVSGATPLVARICGSDSVSHQTNWAHAIENLAQFHPTESLILSRIILMEAERVLSHLNDLSQIPAGVAFPVANQRAMLMKELWQQQLSEIFGHRLLFDTVWPGGARMVDSAKIMELSTHLRREWTPWRQLVENHHGFQDRMRQVGVVRKAEADRWGAQGVVSRASGLDFDVRKICDDYQAFSLRTALETTGDVASRFRVRLHEVEESLRLLQEAAQRLATLPNVIPAWEPPEDLTGKTVTYTESPHGLNAHVVELSRGRITRYHIRSGSFRNWPLMAIAVEGAGIGDFPLINKSFELCYSCHDR